MFRGVSHVGIAVRSIDESLKFFRDALGLSVSKIEEVPHEGVRVAFLPLGNLRLELLEPLGSRSSLHKILEKRGEGVHHIALQVEDMESAVDKLKQHGISILGKPRKGAGGSMVAFIHPKNAHGTLFEFCREMID